MATSKVKSRVTMKTDTTSNWEKATNFIPLSGEICIYSDRIQLDEESYIPGIKVGDGINSINNLKFVENEYISNEEIDSLFS